MPSRCQNTKCSRKCPRVALIPRHCIDSLNIPCVNPHRCSPKCHNPFVHIQQHFGACNANCMASKSEYSKCADCSDDSDSENETKEVPPDVNVEVIQCPYSSSIAQATESPDNEDSPNERSLGTCCDRNMDTKLRNQKCAQREVLPQDFTAHISDNIANEKRSLMTCDRPGVVCSKRLALNKKNNGADQQLYNDQPLQGNSSAAVLCSNHQLDTQNDTLNSQQYPPGSCCKNIPCSTTQSIPDSKTTISQLNHENQQSHVQQHPKQLSAQGLMNQSIPQCINHDLKTDTRNSTLVQVPYFTSSTQNLSDNPDVEQCCANAYSRNKPGSCSPPLPTKGISSASRPGFVIKKETPEPTPEIPAQCMTSTSGCKHGIASIMPNNQTTTIQSDIKSRPSTCSCKSKRKSMKKKNILKQEATTNVCDSVKCLANQNQDCPCRYPPGYSQFSCAGNITGNCKCSGPFQ